MFDENVSDCSSLQGATAMAERIVHYWRTRGYHGITASIVPVTSKYLSRIGDEPFYGIISNIGPTGYPPRTKENPYPYFPP